MSDAIPVSPADIQNLADSVNSLKTGGMIFIVVMAIIILSYMIISKYFTWKKDKLISEQKNARVDAQLKAFQTLNDNLGLMKSELVSQGSSTKLHSEAMLMAQNRVNSQLDEMNKKIKGVIPDVDAAKIIKVYFNTIIKKEVSYLIEAQIIRNGFEGNEIAIRREMKTNIGEVLDRCLEELRGLKLPISVRSIFLTYNDEGERYQICDLIWESIRPILARGGDKPRNIAEAKVIISNVISDYINPVIKDLTDSPTDLYNAALIAKPHANAGDSTKYKTPSQMSLQQQLPK